MYEENKIKEAVDLWQAGKRSLARNILLDLESKIQEPNMRLNFINVSLSILSPIDDNPKITNLAREGITLANAHHLHEYHAHFTSRLADALMLPVSMNKHRIASLTLSPRWFAFATEEEKSEYDSLVEQTKKLDQEVDDLLIQADSIAEKTKSKNVQAFVLMARASIESSRYVQAMSDCFKGKWYSRLWLRYPSMRHPIFEYLFMLGRREGKELRKHIRKFSHSFIRAANLFESEGDNSSTANAYYNLANDLRTAHRFGAATKYINLAKKHGEKAQDQFILKKIFKMEESIKQKNRDVPDYLNGERRDLDEV